MPTTAMPVAAVQRASGRRRSTAHSSSAAKIGPDLTHFGSRPTLAAGILPMTHANIARFVRQPGKTKPGVRMPAFPRMSAAEADQIASYLQGLK